MRTLLFFVLIISTMIFLSVSSTSVYAPIIEGCENTGSDIAGCTSECSFRNRNTCQNTCCSGSTCYYSLYTPYGENGCAQESPWNPFSNFVCHYSNKDTKPSDYCSGGTKSCTSTGWTCSCPSETRFDGTKCIPQKPCSYFNNNPNDCNSYYFNNNYPCSYCFSTNKCYTKQEYSSKCPSPRDRLLNE